MTTPHGNNPMHWPEALHSCHGNFGLGALIFVETHRRILGGAFGRIPAPISTDAFDQAGYCLDAPSLLPAGGCRVHSFGPDVDDWIIEQVTVERAP